MIEHLDNVLAVHIHKCPRVLVAVQECLTHGLVSHCEIVLHKVIPLSQVMQWVKLI